MSAQPQTFQSGNVWTPAPRRRESFVNVQNLPQSSTTAAGAIGVEFEVVKQNQGHAHFKVVGQVTKPIAGPSSHLREVYECVAKDQSQRASDILFRTVNDLLKTKQFAQCDDLLRATNVKLLNTHAMVAILAATKPAVGLLTARPRLLERIEKRLEAIDSQRAPRLLKNVR